jgi:hypothetical protein
MKDQRMPYGKYSVRLSPRSTLTLYFSNRIRYVGLLLVASALCMRISVQLVDSVAKQRRSKVNSVTFVTFVTRTFSSTYCMGTSKCLTESLIPPQHLSLTIPLYLHSLAPRTAPSSFKIHLLAVQYYVCFARTRTTSTRLSKPFHGRAAQPNRGVCSSTS